jgi:hypothetical protein
MTDQISLAELLHVRQGSGQTHQQGFPCRGIIKPVISTVRAGYHARPLSPEFQRPPLFKKVVNECGMSRFGLLEIEFTRDRVRQLQQRD